MNREEVLAKIESGRFLLVGEFRGGRADARGFVDTKSGKACQNVVISYAVECAITNGFDQILVRQRAPSSVTDPGNVAISLEKGRRYVFEIESMNKERGMITAWLGLREPEPFEA
jgi:hypothetical protein